MGAYWSSEDTDDIRQYGWRRDRPDIRDEYHEFSEYSSSELPAKVDLRDKCPPVYNQGKLGSCTANAIVGAYQFDEIHQEEPSPINPSRLFLYYNERDTEGHDDTDSGAEIRDGIKSICKVGLCSEASWPYDITKFTEKPSENCYQEATQHQCVKYRRVSQNVNDLRTCLARGNPFVFGFEVFRSFEAQEVAQTGIMRMPTEGEEVLGGHAVMCVGYSDSKRCFLVRNSWGEDWGEAGYFWMPYRFMEDKKYCSDFWTVITVHDLIKQ